MNSNKTKEGGAEDWNPLLDNIKHISARKLQKVFDKFPQILAVDKMTDLSFDKWVLKNHILLFI